MISRFLCTVAVGLCILSKPVHATSCVSDINGDSVTDIGDLLAVLNSWGACAAPCPADLVVPWGLVNVADLLVVINNWGPCPCQPQNGCAQGYSLWCEDFELGNYSRWTGGYEATGPCRNSGFSNNQFVSTNRSHRSQITCSTPESHRDYGGLRFNGDNLVPSFQISSPGGTVAPHGVICRFWVYLDTPHTFSPWQWVSLMTATHDCSNNWSGVITVNIDDSTGRLKPVHVGSVTYAPNAPAFPLRQWNRVTVYLNYFDGTMHVWQNGTKIASATFTRPSTTICQWHWGLYASGNNSNIIMYEDDIRIIKLTQPLVNFTAEPWVPGLGGPCSSNFDD